MEKGKGKKKKGENLKTPNQRVAELNTQIHKMLKEIGDNLFPAYDCDWGHVGSTNEVHSKVKDALNFLLDTEV